MYVTDADFVLMGHVHNEYIFPLTRQKLTKYNNVEYQRQYHIRVAGYKDEYDDGAGGWHVGRGAPPKPLGGVWIRFSFSRRLSKIVSDVFLTGES